MEMPPGPPSPGGAPPVVPDQVEAEGDEAPPPRDGLLADEEANRRLVATTAALALVAVAIMIGVFLLTRDSGDDLTPPATGAAPVVTAAPPAPVDEAELSALVEELQDFVAEERGLEFEEDIRFESLPPEEYQERVRRDLDQDLADDPALEGLIRQQADFYGALGLWTTDDDPVDVLRELYAVASLGFYDPETGSLVLRGGQITPLVRSTLVHELTHALEDQHFDLDRPALERSTAEDGFAFHAVAEGSAGRVEDAYRATLTEEERSGILSEEAAITASVDLTAFPPILLVEQNFLYRRGLEFVDELVDEGGTAQVDRALQEPPTTSEHIMEPETWLDGEATATIDLPAADGEVAGDGVAGQFLIEQLSSYGGTAEDPHELESEWDGDRYVLWEEGDDVCARIRVAGDASGLAAELEPWADAVAEAEAATVDLDVDGDELLVTSCG